MRVPVLLFMMAAQVTAAVAAAALATAEDGLDRFWALSWVGFPVVGAMILVRRPGNRIGRVLFASGGCINLAVAWAVVGPVVSPEGATFLWGSWFGSWLPLVGFGLLPFFLLWYPTGQPPSPSWRLWGRVAGVWLTVVTLYYAVRPGVFIDSPVSNPIGIQALAGMRNGAIEQAAGGSLLVFGLAAFVSIVTRWRRAKSVERQQLKWLALAGLSFVALDAVAVMVGENPVGDFFAIGAFVVGLNGMAAAVGLAVFRYRLFEIDRVISRTVGYAVVALLVGGVYAAGVFVTQLLLPTSSDLGVAASTLAAAALIAPLRRRTQGWVDRRFNRARYDAGRVVEVMAARLRDQVNLSELTGQLMGAVARTLQPASLAVWVRGEQT